MSLAKYRKMRDFAKTQEPSGKARRKAGNSYVIQKHAASHLHYDFRLELDGVLLSWAVPQRADPRSEREALGRANGGPPARIRRLRRQHPGG